MYQEYFDITDLYADRFERMRPAAMLYCAQEVAGKHCDELGIIPAEKGLFWALTRTHVQITRMPQRGEKIRVETWPMPTTRVAYPRSTVAYDAGGKECFRAISLWVLMEEKSRAMVLPGKSGVEVPGELTGSELAIPGGLALRELGKRQERTVRFSDLDRNGHMNNTRCMSWLEDLLPGSFHEQHIPRDITVCYHREAREGEALLLQYDFLPGNSLQMDAIREDQRIFTVKVDY